MIVWQKMTVNIETSQLLMIYEYSYFPSVQRCLSLVIAKANTGHMEPCNNKWLPRTKVLVLAKIYTSLQLQI